MIKKRAAAASNENQELHDVVKAARDGDRSAFGLLIEQTQNRLFRFCFTLTGNKTHAEDLCQDAFLKAYQNLAKLEKAESFIDWLFRITKNLHLDHVRSASSRETPTEEADLDAGGVTPSADLGDLLAVHKALSQFDPEDRVLLLLVDLEERTYSEAASILGISEDAVRSRLFRVRKTFLEKWSDSETK